MVMRDFSSYGPFRADSLRSGDPYELSNGHPIQCMPTGGAGSEKNRLGASVVGWDPSVKEAGVDTGYSPDEGTLRAPDVAVGNVPDKPGWVKGAPELAIEYADVGQDEEKLGEKITDLMKAGTRYLWVVRLVGPRRVEVHEQGKTMKLARPGDLLLAPGVLKNPVKVEALYDRDEAERATLINLLQRQGFESLDAVIEKGREEGREEGVQHAILTVLSARGLTVDALIKARVEGTRDAALLDRWLARAAIVKKAHELFEETGNR